MVFLLSRSVSEEGNREFLIAPVAQVLMLRELELVLLTHPLPLLRKASPRNLDLRDGQHTSKDTNNTGHRTEI